jgi:flagellar motor component MotA
VIQEMTLEAVLSIVEGVNPRALEMQLNKYHVSAKKHGPQKVASR